MRFTLGKLFLAVAILSLGFAGIFYRNHFWACLVLSATLVMFIGCGMSVTKTSDAKQARTIWFLIVGVFYLLLTTSPLLGDYGQYAVTNYPLAALARALRQGYGEGYPLTSIVKV